MRVNPFLKTAIFLLGLLCACTGGRKTEPPARLTILVSGNTMGYLRNCGCASGQYGGELRRARLIKQERESALQQKATDKGRESTVLLLDQGSTLGGVEHIDRLYSKQVIKSMAQTGYNMLGLGESDLQFGQEDLYNYLKEAGEVDKESGFPLTAVNLHFSKPASGTDYSRELNEMIQKYQIIDAGDNFKVGIIHAIDPGVTINVEDGQKVEEKYGFKVMPVAKATQQVLDQHASEADFWIFSLADGIEGVTDAKEIADIKGLDLVIGFERGNPNQSTSAGGVVWPYFIKGPVLKARDMVKIVVNFPSDKNAEPTIAAQQLAVGSNIKGDEQVLALIEEIWPEIEKWENEKLESQDSHVRPRIMGQQTCATCHPNIHAAMLLTKHQLAYTSLEHAAETDPERKNAHRDSKCLSCHVTEYISPHGGWNKLDKQENLAMVSCESCHGPGEYHTIWMVEKANGRTIDQVTQIPEGELSADGRTPNGILRASSDTCIECHDAENSPKFNFEEYWSKIQHSLDMPMPDPSDPIAAH